jgi:hypothetical protein
MSAIYIKNTNELKINILIISTIDETPFAKKFIANKKMIQQNILY